ncbi:hypothetical protein PHYBOEH_011847 [Phytophthora boehmeriae]|uniref:Temptin Cys/Cys disulfide domain-containing protein n=1 Tax=Phytophthora boehmeriae TaxID=109152 RepID=A0A8T1WWM5_9STRA|nr:hypothetical protein PHYBOEH_011847 [Phytophthora boehmeriae]
MRRSVAATLVLGLPAVHGYAKYVALLPNGDNVPDSPNIGHLDPAGETGVNDFGTAFASAGNAWTVALCQEDTDGDGFTNGQELGDPCCTWTSSNTAGLITDGVSHPSDATKTPTNAELKAGCSSSSTTASSTAGSGGMSDVVGTVAPAGGANQMPPDDDEDDSDESAPLTSDASVATYSGVAMAIAAVVAAFW